MENKNRNYLYKSETTGIIVLDVALSILSPLLKYYVLAINDDDYYGIIVPVWVTDYKKMDIFPNSNLLAENFSTEEWIKKIQTTIDEFVEKDIVQVVRL